MHGQTPPKRRGGLIERAVRKRLPTLDQRSRSATWSGIGAKGKPFEGKLRVSLCRIVDISLGSPEKIRRELIVLLATCIRL